MKNKNNQYLKTRYMRATTTNQKGKKDLAYGNSIARAVGCKKKELC